MSSTPSTNVQPTYLANYSPPDWWVDHIALKFELDFAATLVHARLSLRRNMDKPRADLWLDGEQLELLSIALDGKQLSKAEYTVQANGLRIALDQDNAILETCVRILPDQNTALEGLYKSGKFLLTQCEAEGFRRISYFPDRPDVMARFDVELIGDKQHFPVLLANGNPAQSGDLGEGKHFARWSDPWPKPAYLFAIAAGELAHIESHFTTAEDRQVRLRIYAESDVIDRCDHAMQALIASMRWDQQRFGRCYDLDVFNIVATHDFNMGAMENKGLNIFNTAVLIADIQSATDHDFKQVEAVVAHEYFHNWTGNRITCRDWFQLSLKEGLTVFRDQEFTADQHSRAVKRIEDVRRLRSMQFIEDGGPFAHSVRPDHYLEINNFYTSTIYDKGAEVIRMMHTLLGADGFRKGMDLYFERHDGQAATCDDFVAALADANAYDFSHFSRWYTQAGTPTISVSSKFDSQKLQLTLRITQHTAATPGQPNKQSLTIPIRVALYNHLGVPQNLTMAGENKATAQSRVLVLTEAEQCFVFTDIADPIIASVLQGFSAPVIVARDAEAKSQLGFLARFDRDPINRWDAFQALYQDLIVQSLAHGKLQTQSTVANNLLEAANALLADSQLDPAFIAECLSLPSEGSLAEGLSDYDPVLLHQLRMATQTLLATALSDSLLQRYREYQTDAADKTDGVSVARRALKNRCLALLMFADAKQAAQLAKLQYQSAGNMTDRLAALTALVHHDSNYAKSALDEFAQRYQDNTLAMDKWLGVQASNPTTGALARLQALAGSPVFSIKNPNKVRALYGAFVGANRAQFHQADGAAYQAVADFILQLNAINPQIASRLVACFNTWKKVEPQRSALMQKQLQRMSASELSPNVREIVQRALADSN